MAVGSALQGVPPTAHVWRHCSAPNPTPYSSLSPNPGVALLALVRARLRAAAGSGAAGIQVCWRRAEGTELIGCSSRANREVVGAAQRARRISIGALSHLGIISSARLLGGSDERECATVIATVRTECEKWALSVPPRACDCELRHDV